MDTKLNFSSAYHPQNDGQTERTNQILEDLFRACTLKFGKNWDKSLPYAEFSYNNGYKQVSGWHLLKHCVDGNVGPCCFGVRQEKAKCLGRRY
jgi:hypothetical protein